MKILLRAFGGRLKGYMEVPENTTFRFDLVLTQPIQAYSDGFTKHDMMSAPLHTRCTFEWTGNYEGSNEDSARIYELISIDKVR